jgi:5'-nucleotidase
MSKMTGTCKDSDKDAAHSFKLILFRFISLQAFCFFVFLFVLGFPLSSQTAAAAFEINSTDNATTVAENNLTNATEVRVQILAINDLHGQMEPPSSKIAVGYNKTGAPTKIDVGGMEYLATHLKRLRSENPNTFVVSAGDMVGASPLMSGLFHDEPTILGLNEIGMDYSAVGNHEFDEGLAELLRLQNGGCSPATGCQAGSSFEGANFTYLAANVVNNTTGEAIFPPFAVKEVQGVPIAFIGVALQSTPSVECPKSVEGLRFKDEVATINESVRELERLGVQTIVVLIHEGGYNDGLYNQSVNMTGPILDIVNRSDPEVDLFITGHTHQMYLAKSNGKTLASSGNIGKVIMDFDLVIDPVSRDVVNLSADNVAVSRDVPKDEGMTELIEFYSEKSSPIANKVVGNITSDILRDPNQAGESSLGDIVADGQLEATRSALNGSSVAAFVNIGGIRTDLRFSEIAGSEKPGMVTYGEMFAVQPFGNNIVVMTLNGSQIKALLEQQFDNPTPGQNRILQVSDGFSYTWNNSAPFGSKVDVSSIRIGGKPLDLSANYRITVNNYISNGGDGFTVLLEGIDQLGGGPELEAFTEYLAEHSPLSPQSPVRITAKNL